MAATPQYGTMIFKGTKTGTTYVRDVYVSDVANAAYRFDAGAGASSTSPDFITFDEPVILTDYSQVTGTADTTKCRVTFNGMPSTHILRYSIHLTSLNNRPQLMIGFKAGTRIGAIQLA